MRHLHEDPSTELRTERRARVRIRTRRNRVIAGSLSALVAIGVLVSTVGSASAEPSAGDWQKLRNCESGGNYAINTGNGYYGAYQFDLGTWRSVGGSGLPSDASPATQDALAYKLWQQRGWSPWACASIVGLPAGGSGGPAPVRVAAKAAPAKPVVRQVGGLDKARYVKRDGRVVVTGWAADLGSRAALSKIRVTVNGRSTTVSTTTPRSAVNRLRGLTGTHGFSFSLPASAGTYVVCASILPKGSSPTVSLGCSTVKVATAISGSAAVQKSYGRAVVTGWTYDNSMPSHSVSVVTTVNGVRHVATANGVSTAIDQRLGITGRHAFRLVYGLHTGRNTVCVQAVGVRASTSYKFGCRVITVAAPKAGVTVMGVARKTLTVRGWSFDPNVATVATKVKIVVNSSSHVVVASLPRRDLNVKAHVPGQHGFAAAIALRSGGNRVCVYAMGTPGVASRLVGCRTVNA